MHKREMVENDLTFQVTGIYRSALARQGMVFVFRRAGMRAWEIAFDRPASAARFEGQEVTHHARSLFGFLAKRAADIAVPTRRRPGAEALIGGFFPSVFRAFADRMATRNGTGPVDKEPENAADFVGEAASIHAANRLNLRMLKL